MTTPAHLLEAQLDYPFGETLPAPGKAMEVAPGVYWLRMGLPFALNHINLWLLEDALDTPAGPRRGWTVVDTGIANDATRALWEEVIASELDGLPIVRVIATHCHPDHVGLADFLCARFDAPLWMTLGEYSFARMMSAGLPGVDGSAMYPHFEKNGLTDESLRGQLKERKNYYPTLVPNVPHAYRRIQDRETVQVGGRGWRVITGFGHAPEHASLYCEALGVLISGDMLLPRISTNVSVFAIEPESNPVQLYLSSLAKYAGLPHATLVLPSHGKPFRGMHVRIAQLHAHHAARMDEVLDACATPQSAVDIVPVMFPRALDAHQLSFAIGEALAHLHWGWYNGQLQRLCGNDGIYRFQRR